MENFESAFEVSKSCLAVILGVLKGSEQQTGGENNSSGE